MSKQHGWLAGLALAVGAAAVLAARSWLPAGAEPFKSVRGREAGNGYAELRVATLELAEPSATRCTRCAGLEPALAALRLRRVPQPIHISSALESATPSLAPASITPA